MLIKENRKINTHIHTTFSDGDSSIEDYVNAAKEFGVSEIGISDHFDYLFKKSYSMRLDQVGEYVQAVEKAKSREDNLKIKLGIEIDYFLGMDSRINSVIKSYNFDFKCISVHWIAGQQINSRKFKDIRQKMSDEEAFDIDKIYYNFLKKSAGLDIDVIGHMGLIKKYDSSPRESTRELEEEVIKTIKEKDKVIELNMAGKKHPGKESYPSKEILKLCYESGIPVTLSNDAHRAKDLATNLGLGMKMLKNAGYDEITTFENRNRVMVEI